jgi:hypothetical protein
VKGALRGFEGVELRDPSELRLPEPPDDRRRSRVRAELVLARPSLEPLARLGLDPDPLGAFAQAFTALRPDAGDRASVCVDLLPAIGRDRRRLSRRLLRDAKRAHRPQPSVGEILRGERPPAMDPFTRREVSRELDAKLNDSGPLFRLQVLVRTQADDRAAAKLVLRSLLASFEQFSDRNWLRVAGWPFRGLGFVGADLPGRRGRFDRRLDSGLFRPARRGVVGAREVLAFLKPPTVHCTAANVVRSGTLLPPPPRLPEFTGQVDLIPLGQVASEDGERRVGVRTADTFFSYVAGRSRYGKTELAIAQFVHLVRSGHGGLFLDPHEDAVARIKRYLTDEGLRERVVEINLAGRATERQPGWNLFELAGREAFDAEARVEAVVDAFASALRWDERNARALNLTTQAAAALTAVARVLPVELAPTIFQLPTLLSDESFRRACLPFLPKASQRFWLDRFPRLSEEAITPVTNLVDRLRASSATTALLGQSQSTYRIREAMDDGLIVLACPGSGGMRDRLVANLLVFDLLHAAKARADVAPDARRPFYVFLDEVQSYDGASSGNLAALLEQSAKYGIRAFLLNQNPERLTPATLNAITTNRSHLMTSALNAHAAGLIIREWGGRPDASAIVKLPRYRFLAQVTDRGEATSPFLLQGLPVEEFFGPGHAEGVDALEQAIAARSGQLVSDTHAHLETLDERIAERFGGGTSGTRARHRRARVGPRSAAGRSGPRGVRRSDPRGGAAAGSHDRGPQSLAQHRLLTTAQLQAIHTPDASARWAQRLLATLERARLAGSIRIEGALKLWHLTEAGSNWLAGSDARGHQRPKVLTAEQAAGQLWRHTLAVNDAGIAFLRAAHERGDEFGPLSWRHEVAHRIGPPGRHRGLVVADALVTYLSSDGDDDSLEYRFLELDRATLTVDRLVAKLAGYTRLYRDRDERGEPAWQRRYLAFPAVLVVLAGERRELLGRRLATAAALCRADPELERAREIAPSFCLLEDLMEHGPFAPIFRSARDPGRAVDWLGTS